MKYEVAIRIQKGIPIPATKRRGGNGRNEAKYPWRQMKVGDSFAWPGEGRTSHTAVAQATRLIGWEFITRKVDGGYRVWRVS